LPSSDEAHNMASQPLI